jgi:hypothetical protein
VVGEAGLVWYYLATPLFALLDLGFGFPVRVAGLADPRHRAVYYVVLMGLGVLVRERRRLAPWVGMAESVVNLVLLFLAILLPIWSFPDQVLAGGGAAPEVMDPPALLNALVAGTVLAVAFYRNQWAALGRNGRTRM